ncbi:hypothetical protein [Kochikohdavirus PBEF19]|uniref:Uncharacterized protein n=1 Tax=Enterococcus phage PBEF129 TaxID=2696337 RepID=A0A7T3JE77_9CAUD|nr:hypothetical protein [Enterococcus phage PBEF129]
MFLINCSLASLTRLGLNNSEPLSNLGNSRSNIAKSMSTSSLEKETVIISDGLLFSIPFINSSLISISSKIGAISFIK